MADHTARHREPLQVIVDRAPRIYALHCDDRIISWVVDLPTGDAVVIDPAGRLLAQTSLDRIRTRRARYGGPRLVEIVEPPAEPQAA
jgi:ABC-type protease/lipase transport system fused ATPase/permease subunit